MFQLSIMFPFKSRFEVRFWMNVIVIKEDFNNISMILAKCEIEKKIRFRRAVRGPSFQSALSARATGNHISKR